MTVPRFRFAPSPNGALHLGHAYSALLNKNLANDLRGTLLLRIEDIDITRCTPEKRRAMVNDLEWLGLSFDPKTIRMQSEHFELYKTALENLKDIGLVYPAFMTRGEIRAHVQAHESSGTPWPRDPDGSPFYPGIERHFSETKRAEMIAKGRAFSWRLDMERVMDLIQQPLSWSEATDETATAFTVKAANPAAWGDVVIARNDVPVSYHLAVVVDDALQAITHVVRGRDLHDATAVHRLLQTLLGLPEPLYLHHKLILDDDGHKLSKSRGSFALADYRANGIQPEYIREMLKVGTSKKSFEQTHVE